jgi:hypothetical protein
MGSLNDSEITQVVSGYAAGATLKELGMKHGVSYNTIGRILRAQGIKLRPPGQRKMAPQTHRTCRYCGETKPLSEFLKGKRHGLGRSYKCHKCHREATRKQFRAGKLTITEEEYLQMVKAQEGVCAICGNPETASKGEIVNRLAVDHDHSTGVIRGLLCRHCNTALGLFKDSLTRLQAATVYLSRHRDGATTRAEPVVQEDLDDSAS